MTYGQSTFVVWSKLGVHDCIRKLKVGLRLLVAFKHKHSASEIVVNCGRIDGIASQSHLTNLTRFQEASKGPGRFIDVIED